MKRFKFSKLVRDKIPEHMRSDKQIIQDLRELDNDEYVKELQKKVFEEAMELASIRDIKEIKEELADVQEVLDYLKNALKMSVEEVKELQQKKIAKNGAFDKRFYIESVMVDEDSRWCKYYLENPDKYPEVKD